MRRPLTKTNPLVERGSSKVYVDPDFGDLYALAASIPPTIRFMVGKDHYGVASGYGSIHSDITRALYTLGPEATRTVALVLVLSDDFEDWYWSSHPRFPEADSGDGPTLSKGLESLPLQVQRDMEEFRKIWQGMHAESLSLRKAHKAFREAQRVQSNPYVRRPMRRNPALASDLTNPVLRDLEFLAHVHLRIDGRPPSKSDIEELKTMSPAAQVYMDWIKEKGAKYLPAFPPKGEVSQLFCRWVVLDGIREAVRFPMNVHGTAALRAAAAWVRNPTHENSGKAYVAHATAFQEPVLDRDLKGANIASTLAYLAAVSEVPDRNIFFRTLGMSDFINFFPVRALLLLDSLKLLPEPEIG